MRDYDDIIRPIAVSCYGKRMFGNTYTIDDLMQEGRIKVFMALPHVRPGADTVPFLRICLRNHYIKLAQRENTTRKPPCTYTPLVDIVCDDEMDKEAERELLNCIAVADIYAMKNPLDEQFKGYGRFAVLLSEGYSIFEAGNLLGWRKQRRELAIIAIMHFLEVSS